MHRSAAVDAAVARAQRFPSMGSHDSREAHLLSSSPEFDMETAEEEAEDAESSGGIMQMAKRLSKLEESQKRIEDLLIKISKSQDDK